ncbi:MAG: histidinol-phosphate transaminase [Actinomycetota bacterium]
MVTLFTGGRKTPPVRDDLQGIKPYAVPVTRAQVELDSNENPWNLPDEVIKDVLDTLAGTDFNRYPDIGVKWLRQNLADGYQLGLENVMAGNGSNEVILDLLLAFGGPGRKAMLFEPTYSMHDVLCRIASTEAVLVPLEKDFSFDVDAAREAFNRNKPDIVFLNSPNNPTGNLIPQSDIEQVCRMGDFLVVVDEAYGEFSGETCLSLIKQYKNLVVVKTFSKAFRLAAARVGYALADEGIITGLDKVKLPYNLNGLSQITAALVWQRKDAVLRKVAEIVDERDRVLMALEEMAGNKPFPSYANFILFRTERDANAVFDGLLGKGVQIRNFSGKPYLENCLRVTIGTPDENSAFLAALKESL